VLRVVAAHDVEPAVDVVLGDPLVYYALTDRHVLRLVQTAIEHDAEKR
jgi:hypothetical protein